jgi:type IV pilus assembly protein PilE
MNPANQRSRGFSLIELLIVVAVIAIIAAVAVPNLQSSKKAANEAAAIAHLRTWTSAQELYFQRHQVYAGNEQDLVNEGLVGNPDPEQSGYVFALAGGGAGTIEWSGTATPQQEGVTGDRYFYIDQTGVIRWALGGAAGAGSTPLGAPE